MPDPNFVFALQWLAIAAAAAAVFGLWALILGACIDWALGRPTVYFVERCKRCEALDDQDDDDDDDDQAEPEQPPTGHVYTRPHSE